MTGKVRYPVRPLGFRVLNKLIHYAPVAKKYAHNSILFRKRLVESKSVDIFTRYNFGLASSEDVDFLARHPEGLSESVYTSRLGRGDRCYCLRNGTEVISYNWVARSLCCILCGYDRGLEFFPLHPGQVFTYDFYTYKPHRGGGFGSLLKSLLIQTMMHEGVREVFTLLMPHSSASIKIHLKLGYEPLFMVYGYRMLGWSRTFYGRSEDKDWLDKWIDGFKIANGIV